MLSTRRGLFSKRALSLHLLALFTGLAVLLAILATSKVAASNEERHQPLGQVAVTATPVPAGQNFAFPGPQAVTTADLVSNRPLYPEQFGEATQQLTDVIAVLNDAEWTFIRDASSGDPTFADQDLLDIAADSFAVARSGEKLAESANTQGAAPAAIETYKRIARFGYALMIESQNVRGDLDNGAIEAVTAAKRIGTLAARLLTPRIINTSGQENPFAQFVDPANPLPAGQPMTQDVYNQLLGATKQQIQTDLDVYEWLSG